MTQFLLAIKLEGMWDEFRRAHGLGNGRENRKKFIDIMFQIFMKQEVQNPNGQTR